MSKKYIAEFIGTFTLSFIVLLAVSFSGNLPLAVPLIASLTLALFVYTIGPFSGCHINPAVTLGQLSVDKISRPEAINYIIAQLLGGAGALFVAKMFVVTTALSGGDFSILVFLAEMLGAFFFNFGIAAVVYGKVKDQMSGLVVGGSLLLGVMVASFTGANGILNPAVAVSLNSLNIVYGLAPIVGAVLAFKCYKYLSSSK